jgi:hypothetical protein
MPTIIGDAYEEYVLPIWGRLDQMKRQGSYTRDTAIALFRPVVDIAAARWNREFRDPDARRRFPPDVRQEVAKDFAGYFEAEYRIRPEVPRPSADVAAGSTLERDIQRVSGVRSSPRTARRARRR